MVHLSVSESDQKLSPAACRDLPSGAITSPCPHLVQMCQAQQCAAILEGLQGQQVHIEGQGLGHAGLSELLHCIPRCRQRGAKGYQEGVVQALLESPANLGSCGAILQQTGYLIDYDKMQQVAFTQTLHGVGCCGAVPQQRSCSGRRCQMSDAAFAALNPPAAGIRRFPKAWWTCAAVVPPCSRHASNHPASCHKAQAGALATLG